jgi:hypothetical protein
MFRLLFSVVLLSLTVAGLTFCTGPKAALTKSQGASSAGAGMPPAATGGQPAVAGAPPAATGGQPAAATAPPTNPNAGSDAFWKLAMQRYTPPASGLHPATAAPTLPSTTGMSTAVTPPPAVSTTPPASKPAVGGVPARELNPADIPFATWAPGKRGVVKSPFDPDGRLIDVRDFNPGQLSQCPYSGKIFRVPPMK